VGADDVTISRETFGGGDISECVGKSSVFVEERLQGSRVSTNFTTEQFTLFRVFLAVEEVMGDGFWDSAVVAEGRVRCFDFLEEDAESYMASSELGENAGGRLGETA